MNFIDSGVSCQPSLFNIQTNQIREEYYEKRKKILIIIGIILLIIFLLLAFIITLIYLFKNKNYTQSVCDNNLNPTTYTTSIQTTTITTTTTQQSSTTDQIEERIFNLNPCIEFNIEYTKWGINIQNYSLYSFDVSILTLNAYISFNITIYPPDIGCTWSLDIYPLDGRIIPFNGRPTTSVYGLYDQPQDVTVEQSTIITTDQWTNGTGKFAVGFTGAWYGTANDGCQGYGKMTICFSSSTN